MNLLAVTAAVALVLDQITKWVAVTSQPHEVSVIGKFFQLTFVTNRGAAWGMFSRMDYSNAVLAAFSIVTALALFGWRRSLTCDNRWQELALGSIVGGIFGNLADRIQHGYVVDFMDFYLGSSIGHWPAFNVADMAIFIGVVLYLWHSLRGHAAAAHAVIKSEGMQQR